MFCAKWGRDPGEFTKARKVPIHISFSIEMHMDSERMDLLDYQL